MKYDEVIAFLNCRDDRGQIITKPHRLPSEQYTFSGTEFFFTINASEHQRPFTDDAFARKIVDSLLWRRQKDGLYLLCYCLMPDHLHFLLQVRDMINEYRNMGVLGNVPKSVLTSIEDFKSYTTSQIWWKHGGAGKLWQRSYYDHALRHNGEIAETINYILMNPVRKGIVDEWQQYPYSAIVDPSMW